MKNSRDFYLKIFSFWRWIFLYFWIGMFSYCLFMKRSFTHTERRCNSFCAKGERPAQHINSRSLIGTFVVRFFIPHIFSCHEFFDCGSSLTVLTLSSLSLWSGLFHPITMLWANSSDDKMKTFYLFFLENRILRRQFAWSVRYYFLGKIRRIFQNVVCWNFYLAC